MPDLDHLFVAGYVEGQDFQSPLSVRAKSPPDRDRNKHGNRLLTQLQRMATEIERLRQLRAASGTPEHQGVAIALEISPPGTLDPGKQLEWKRDGIEVLSVVEAPNAEIINVYVPPGKLGAVGAHTDLIEFDHDKWPDLQPIASPGSLSPSSRTSLMWPERWPVKPDVVAEGGNGCIDGTATPQVTVGPEDLRLVTTSHEPARTLLAESGDTSAAAAEVARICAHLQSRYPNYWPETIRALVVQGAGYTQAMRSDQGIVPTYANRRTLLRRYGHGRVSVESSLNSALYRPTIIQQETIVPYVLEGSTYRLGQMNAHKMPWPKAELERLAEAEVFMKITLSYFIQPNPSRRGWHSKFRYQSHGLRFAVRGASETEERSQGSLHSDTWYGLASELANKSEIAVFPVGGWWKEMAGRTQPNRRVRYSLVLSLDVSANADVDIYTPIANQIVVPVDLA
jgi:hypothetical protein